MDIVDHETLLGWLTRLQLTAIRNQLDSLLDEAAEKKLTLREALAFLVEREVSRKDERRIEMALKIAHFPAVRELADFDFKAQPSIDERQVREPDMTADEAEALALRQPGDIVRPLVVVGKLHFRAGEDDERPMRGLDRPQQLLPGAVDDVQLSRIPGVDGRMPDTCEEEQLTTHGQDNFRGRKTPIRDLIGKGCLAGREHAEHQRLPLSPTNRETSSEKRPRRPEAV